MLILLLTQRATLDEREDKQNRSEIITLIILLTMTANVVQYLNILCDINQNSQIAKCIRQEIGEVYT